MAQPKLRAEDPGSIPSLHMGAHNHLQLQFQALFLPLQSLHSHGTKAKHSNTENKNEPCEKSVWLLLTINLRFY